MPHHHANPAKTFMRMNTARTLHALIATALLITSCSSGTGGRNTTTPVDAQISLEDAILPVNTQAPLPLDATGIDISRTDLSWTSSNPTTATIDDQGALTAITPGGTTVTATLKTDTRISDTATITVINLPSSDTLAIEKPGDSTLLIDGEPRTVRPTPRDDTTLGYTLTEGTIQLQGLTANQSTLPILQRQPILYVPSDGTVAITLGDLTPGTQATVLVGSENHVLAMGTANAEGALQIRAQIPDDLPHGTQPLILLVAPPTSTPAAQATTPPTNAMASTTSNDLTLLAIGIQVTDPTIPTIHAIEISQGDTQLAAGRTRTLNPRLITTGNPDATLTWTSRNPEIATIDDEGTLEALTAGETEITVQSIRYPSATDTITVTVTPEVVDLTKSTITISPATLTADGTSIAAITIQLKDANGNDFEQSGGTVTIDAPALGTVSTVRDNDDGTYAATYTAGTTTGTDTIQAKVDGASLTTSASITLIPVVPPPAITGPSGGAGASASAISVQENQTTIFTMSASEAVTWSKAGGADADLINLGASTGELTFASAPDFETPQDADGDNTYTVVVRATGTTGKSSDQTVTITVTDVNEGAATIKVYAVDYDNGALISFETDDPAGTRTTLLTGGSLVSPAALALGPDGNLYIGENGDASTYAPRISKVEPSTLTLSTVYAFSSFDVFPASLAFTGNDLLMGRNPDLSDTGPIVKLTNATGGVPAISDYTSGGSLASSPGIALAADGTLYVSDQTFNFGTSIASGPVKRFNAGGVYVDEVIADGASGLAGPDGMAIDGNALYTSSFMSGTVLKTDLTTGATTEFFDTEVPNGVGPLAVLSNGDLMVGSPSGLIYHVAADGTLLATWASGLGEVGGLVGHATTGSTAISHTRP